MSPWEVDPMAVALGELDPPERAEAERLLREDPGFRAEVARLGRVTRALSGMPGGAWTASEPSPPALDHTAARAARAPGAAPDEAAAPADAPAGGRGELPDGDRPTDPRGRTRRRGPRVRRGPGAGLRRAPGVLVLRPLSAGLAALALLAAGAGGTVLAGLGQDAADPRPEPSATRAPAPAPERVVPLEPLAPVASGAERARVALPERAGGTVRVAIDGIEPLPEGEFLELWLLGEGDDMVSLGTFRAGPDGRVRVALPLGVDPGGARFVDLSVERDDGDPTHSRRSVLRSNALS